MNVYVYDDESVIYFSVGNCKDTPLMKDIVDVLTDIRDFLTRTNSE